MFPSIPTSYFMCIHGGPINQSPQFRFFCSCCGYHNVDADVFSYLTIPKYPFSFISLKSFVFLQGFRGILACLTGICVLTEFLFCNHPFLLSRSFSFILNCKNPGSFVSSWASCCPPTQPLQFLLEEQILQAWMSSWFSAAHFPFHLKSHIIMNAFPWLSCVLPSSLCL